MSPLKSRGETFSGKSGGEATEVILPKKSALWADFFVCRAEEVSSTNSRSSFVEDLPFVERLK